MKCKGDHAAGSRERMRQSSLSADSLEQLPPWQVMEATG